MISFFFYIFNRITGFSFYFFSYFLYIFIFFICYFLFYNFYVFIFLFFIFIVFLFYYFYHIIFSFFSHKEPIIRITSDRTLVLYLNNNKVVHIKKPTDIYILETAIKYKDLYKCIKMFKFILYNKGKSINRRLINKICNNPDLFYILLSHFEFFFFSFFFFFLVVV